MATATKLLHKTKRLLMGTRRRIYGLRSFVPFWRERHQLEAMVGPLGFWNELQQYQMHVLLTAGLKPEHSLIDIGCGPLQGGVPCIRYLDSNNYFGVDNSGDRIRASYGQVDRHDLADKNPRLLVSDSFGDEELLADSFDYMWASQILCYFDEALLRRLFEFIRKRLKPGGKFLGDIYNPDHYEFRYPEQLGKYMRHTTESLQLLAAQYGLQVRCLGQIGEFNYPARLSLRTNLLMEITRASV